MRQSLSPKKLTSGATLARNTLWNLLGHVIPLLIGIIAIPILIKGLGTERFGILAIVWMFIGYFSLFDLGLGRALTKLVSDKLGSEEKTREDIYSLYVTALWLMAFLGLFGSVIVITISPWLVESVLKISLNLQDETLKSFYILALAIPFVVTSTGFKGCLEACQCFKQINAVRIFFGVFTFMGPALALLLSNHLTFVTTILVIGRIIAWAFLFLFSSKLPFKKFNKRGFNTLHIRPLISFGGWMTVSNIIGPLMVYLDRFLIGALISVTAVTYYTTPYEVISRLQVIPVALVGVTFPAFSVLFLQDRQRAAQLYFRSLKYIFIILFPVILVALVFASDGLNIWLNSEFAKQSTFVFQCIAIGVFINSLARAALTVVHGAGRPDWSAKVHMMELPFYLLSIWWLLKYYGINGAAMAWTLRVLIDTAILFYLAQRLIPESRAATFKIVKLTIASITLFIIGTLMHGLLPKITFTISTLTISITYFWFFLLDSQERHVITERLYDIHAQSKTIKSII